MCLKNRQKKRPDRPDLTKSGRFRTDGRPDSASGSVRKRPKASGQTSIYASVRPGYVYIHNRIRTLNVRTVGCLDGGMFGQ
jgi:hypothetical protein